MFCSPHVLTSAAPQQLRKSEPEYFFSTQPVVNILHLYHKFSKVLFVAISTPSDPTDVRSHIIFNTLIKGSLEKYMYSNLISVMFQHSNVALF